jgi:hypothetical protein
MNKTIRMAVLWLAALALVLSGCAGAAPTAASPAQNVQSQPIVLQNPPAVEQVPVQEPAPAAAVAAPPQYASLDGLVWEDEDRDGLQDLNERGIANVVVTLLTSAGITAGTNTTNGNGAYKFKDVVPGDYLVNLVPPAGYVFSPQDQGVNELVDSDTDPRTSQTIPVPLLAGENGLVYTTGIYSPSAVTTQAGTVKPPPPNINVCAPGTYSLGGISTLVVNALSAGYCINAYLWNHAFAIGQIPGGAGRLLAEVTFVEYFYQGTFVYQYDVPGETDSIQVCYAVPGNIKQAQIYFFDHYGPRFGNPHTGGATWIPVETTIQNGIACATAETSGAYALIGK